MWARVVFIIMAVVVHNKRGDQSQAHVCMLADSCGPCVAELARSGVHNVMCASCVHCVYVVVGSYQLAVFAVTGP